MDNETTTTSNPNNNPNNLGTSATTDTGVTIWHDTDRLLGEKLDEPVTKQEILDWIHKYADSEIFLIRNISSIRSAARCN